MCGKADGWVMTGGHRVVGEHPDLRGTPWCSSCIPTAAGGFGKVLWLSASRGSWTAKVWETITLSLSVIQNAPKCCFSAWKRSNISSFPAPLREHRAARSTDPLLFLSVKTPRGATLTVRKQAAVSQHCWGVLLSKWCKTVTSNCSTQT